MGADASVTQLGFGDIGVDPGHYHVVWGVEPDEEEVGVGAYQTVEDARSTMDYWIGEVHWQEGREPESRSDDRVEYHVEDDSPDGYKLGWIRVAECSNWKCRKNGQVEGAEN